MLKYAQSTQFQSGKLGFRKFQYLSDVDYLSVGGTEFKPPIHLLLLADDRHPANVVQDHIRSIKGLTRNKITIANPRYLSNPGLLSADCFDAILIHYSIFILADTYLPIVWQSFLINFSGPKVIIREDEYQQVNRFKQKILELGIDVVLSPLDSPKTLECVYGGEPLSKTIFFSCLPGYIAEKYHEFVPPPIAQRPLDIVYRGRSLPEQLGRHAQDKKKIGDQILALAAEYELKVDISSNETDRIYGDAWPRFLMSGRAMLGVEGGASIFDFDGQLANAVKDYKFAHPNADFEEVWSEVLSAHEANVDFRTITPKFFEAIATKTALILYPGKYNGILHPHRHYIPLERDGSNIKEVVAKLRDESYLQELVDRTYEEILFRDDLSTQFYVSRVDLVLSHVKENFDKAPGHSSKFLLQQELVSIRQGIASTQLALAFVQQELVSTQQELVLTQQELVSTQQELAELANRCGKLEGLLVSEKHLSVLIAKAIARRIRRLSKHLF